MSRSYVVLRCTAGATSPVAGSMSRPTRTAIVSIFTVVSTSLAVVGQCNLRAARRTYAWAGPDLKISKDSCAFTDSNGGSSASAGYSSRCSWRSRSPACSAAGRSATRARQARPGRIDYERFVRNGSPSEFVITPTSGAAHGVSRIEISADYLEAFRVERITPEPATRAHGGRAARLRVRRVVARRIHFFPCRSAAAVASPRSGTDRRRRRRSKSGSSLIPDRNPRGDSWNPSSARRSCTCSCWCCCA